MDSVRASYTVASESNLDISKNIFIEFHDVNDVINSITLHMQWTEQIKAQENS